MRFERRAEAGRARLLPIPRPYRCWIALSNDPDATTMREWEELHRLVWEDLRLPFADSFFLFNHSERYPDQVCVERYPHIIGAHPHDTMHTWGDFCETTTHVFTRNDALRGLELLRAHHITPRVWVDHASFAGNLLHNQIRASGVARFLDASEHEHENLAYSLDLIERAGVRYVWDGTLTPIMGQDRPLGRRAWYAAIGRQYPDLWAASDVLGKWLWRRIDARAFNYDHERNAQQAAHIFSDCQTFYTFPRYGCWNLADIDGFAQLIDPSAITELARTNGTMILYTHLGKRRGDAAPQRRHVPPETERALRELATRYHDGEVMLSSVSRLLDYLVTRDACLVTSNTIDFRADGVRFKRLTSDDLAGLSFGFFGDATQLQVRCEGIAIPFEKHPTGDGSWRIDFKKDEPSILLAIGTVTPHKSLMK